MSDKNAVLTRSWLFTPATHVERFDSALKKGADVSILDLEDSVAPAEKDAARAHVMTFLASDSQNYAVRALRINDIATHYGIRDIAALLSSKTDLAFIIMPKTESPAHLRIMDRLLTAAGSGTRLVALIESVEGLKNVGAIASSTPRLAGLMFGAADMASDLGCAAAWEPLLHARSQLVSACASAGIAAIDTPFFDIHNGTGLSEEVMKAQSLGFTAKAAIHPAQVSVINEILTPSEDDIAYARAVLAENARGVGVVDGKMIDEAVARQARRLLNRAGLASDLHSEQTGEQHG